MLIPQKLPNSSRMEVVEDLVSGYDAFWLYQRRCVVNRIEVIIAAAIGHYCPKPLDGAINEGEVYHV